MPAPTPGTVVRAVVPFAPAPPFQIYAGHERKPYEAGLPALLKAQEQAGDSEFPFITRGKARPVLILSDISDERVSEVIALRLARFSKLTADEQERVREQKEEGLFHLPPQRFKLPEENAAILASMVRVPVTALEGKVLGRLNDSELEILHERVIRQYGLRVERINRAFLAKVRAGERRG